MKTTVPSSESDYFVEGGKLFRVIHERAHVSMIARADALVNIVPNTAFQFGWSWNQSAHNHWNPGADHAWGVINVDDDGNGIVDDAATQPPFEPGHGDDTLLSDLLVNREWPLAWPMPRPTIHSNPFECEAINAENVMNDDDDIKDDWANPGKQHAGSSYDD